MRADDAFWAARLLTAFDDDLIRAAVKSAQFSDPEADAYLAQTLIARKDKILQAWLNGVLPLHDFALSREGTLTFTNVAAAAVAAQIREYRIRWFAFDNQAGTTTPLGDEVSVTDTRAAAPPPLLAEPPEFVMIELRGHPRPAPGVGVPDEGLLSARGSERLAACGRRAAALTMRAGRIPAAIHSGPCWPGLRYRTTPMSRCRGSIGL